MNYTNALLTLLIGSSAVFNISTADAVTFTLGNVPQPDQQNVLYQPRQTGTEILGRTNQDSTAVLFASSETLLTPAQGQATLNAADGLINEVSISVPKGTYRSLIINPSLGGGPSAGQSGPLNVVVDTNSGTTPFAYTLERGQNFLTIAGTGNEAILTTRLSSTTGFADLGQVRIGGLAPNGNGNGGENGEVLPQFTPNGITALNGAEIPEPGALWLFATALSALALWRVRSVVVRARREERTRI